MVLAHLTVFGINLIYSACLPDIKEAVFWPDMRSTQNLCEYIRLGLPSAFMFALDNWAGSMIRFCIGYMAVDIQSAQAILVNIMVLLYQVGSGFDSAACALIGQALGANDLKSSKRFYSTISVIAVTFISLTIGMTYLFFVDLVEIYTNLSSV